jgi:hypothetical protein
MHQRISAVSKTIFIAVPVLSLRLGGRIFRDDEGNRIITCPTGLYF